jgi:primosomal replication protein N
VDRNQLLLDAEILDVGDVRSTPGGIDTVALRLRHVSEQLEAGGNRVVEVTIDASGFGSVAPRLAALGKGQRIAVKGFLTKRSARSDIPVLHINEFKIIETR